MIKLHEDGPFKKSREIRNERKYYENLYEKEQDRKKISYLEKHIFNLLDREEEEVINEINALHAQKILLSSQPKNN